MVDQLQLSFLRKRRIPSDIAALCAWLRGRGLQRAAKIEEALGLNDRYIRDLAHQSQGEIISGQNGYKLTCQATGDEIIRCIRTLRSQADEMRQRSIDIERVHHQAPYQRGGAGSH